MARAGARSTVGDHVAVLAVEGDDATLTWRAPDGRVTARPPVGDRRSNRRDHPREGGAQGPAEGDRHRARPRGGPVHRGPRVAARRVAHALPRASADADDREPAALDAARWRRAHAPSSPPAASSTTSRGRPSARQARRGSGPGTRSTRPTPRSRAWRTRLIELQLRQPFKQAFREVYRLTPAEEETDTYSNRFAAHVLRYPQARALMTARRWGSNFLGPFDGGYNGDREARVPDARASGRSSGTTRARTTTRWRPRSCSAPRTRCGSSERAATGSCSISATCRRSCSRRRCATSTCSSRSRPSVRTRTGRTAGGSGRWPGRSTPTSRRTAQPRSTRARPCAATCSSG